MTNHRTLSVPLTILLLGSLSSSFGFIIITNGGRGGRVATELAVVSGRSSPRSGRERSKRQERVGHLVRTELSQILHSGNIKGNVEYIEDEARQRISVVSADISPDLKQARISVSIRAPGEGEVDSDNPAGAKRRSYSWLVSNTKPIRHTLAQRISHLKSCPSLTFVQVDVAAAVDVMYLIDKVSKGYKRDDVGFIDGEETPTGVVGGVDFDEELDDEDWIEDDEDFF